MSGSASANPNPVEAEGQSTSNASVAELGRSSSASQQQHVPAAAAAAGSTSSSSSHSTSRKRPAELDAHHDRPASSSSSADAGGLENILKCPICFQIFNEPYVTVCGHTFCQKCLRRSLNMRHRCPTCDGELKVDEPNAFPNHTLHDVSQLFRNQLANIKKLRTAIPTRADLLVDADTLTSLAAQLLNSQQSSGQQQQPALDGAQQLHTMHKLLRALHQRYEQLQAEQQVTSRALLCDFIDEMIARRTQLRLQLDAELLLLHADKKALMGATSALSPGDHKQRQNQYSVVPTTDATDASTSADGSGGESMERSLPPPTSIASAELLPTSLTNIAGVHFSNSGQAQNLFRCRQQMMKHYEDLQQEYLQLSADRLQSISATAASDSGTTADEAKLDEFASTLGKITRYSGFRKLASLNYNSDFNGGLSIVSSIEFDKDAEYFVVAGVTRQIKMYDFSSVISAEVDVHYPIGTMQCDTKISCCSWNSYTKSLLANSDYDGAVWLWDTWNTKKIRKYQEHEKRCWTVNFSVCDPLTFASGSDDATVKLWSVNCKSSIANINTGVNVCCAQFSPDSKYHIVIGTADHCAKHYDVRNVQQPVAVFRGHRKAVSYVRYISPTQFVSASTDSELRLWDIASGQCNRVFTGHVNEKNFVGLSVGADFIACGSEKNALHVYHKSIGRSLLEYNFDDSSTSAVFDQRRRNAQPDQPDLQEFVSATCWKKNSNVIVSANSHGDTHILEIV